MPDEIPKGPEEPIPDLNPPIVKWTKKDGVLEKEITHAIPPVHVKTYSIAQAQANLNRIDAVIAVWTAKKAPDQELLDRYNEL